MSALAWTFAAICFLFWCIEHFGGRDARDRLRRQRDQYMDLYARAEFDRMVMESERDVARSLVHPSQRHLRSVD